ncbi:hypothetical protein FTUN_6313 [Frigoriglobus tundricola]|uniref:Uncharacterized protein n=1 Tax=Frigoriglobus tundricola TaxID=2774151 RepID=A0A6M5YXU2_9BACT|nr:hypothetical protein FTUN_6313 [Frigoriglobus tundricola]
MRWPCASALASIGANPDSLHSYFIKRFPHLRNFHFPGLDLDHLFRNYPTLADVDSLLTRTQAARSELGGYGDDNPDLWQVSFMATLLDGTRELSYRAPEAWADRIRALQPSVPRRENLSATS